MTSASRPSDKGAALRFYRSAPRTCAYLPGRMEQLIFAELDRSGAAETYDALTHAGFRRSHNIIYRPACANCAACVPVRIVARAFEPDRTMRRIRRRNGDLVVRIGPARATREQFDVFRRYQGTRHDGSDMADMTFAQYRAMVQETTVDSFVLELMDDDGRLCGAMLADRLGDGLSAVYSFFEPDAGQRSLGTYMILLLVEQAQRLRLSYVYLGYWVEDSPKMTYKTRFRPLEALGTKGWRRL